MEEVIQKKFKKKKKVLEKMFLFATVSCRFLF